MLPGMACLLKVLLRRVLKLLAESNAWPLDQQCTSGAPQWKLPFGGNTTALEAAPPSTTTVFEAALGCRHYEGDTARAN